MPPLSPANNQCPLSVQLRDQVARIRDRNTNIGNPLLLEDFEALRVRKARERGC